MKKNEIVSITIILVAVALYWFDLYSKVLGLNSAQEASFTIMIIAATLWVTEAVPLFVTSFIIVELQVLWLMPELNALGVSSKLQDYLSPFFSNIILLFLGGFTLSSALHKYRLDIRIARLILLKIGSDPSKVMLAIIMICAFLSMWMSNTATAAMMFTVVFPIIQKMPERSLFAKGLTLSIPFACNLGGIGTPIGTPPNAIAISLLANSGITISFLTWMILAVPLMITGLFVLWRILLALFPPNGEKVELDIEIKDGIQSEQYLIIGVFIVTALLWLTADLHKVPLGIVSTIPITMFFGLRILSNDDFRTLSWHVLFMLGGGLSLGYGIAASGLAKLFIEMIPVGIEAWAIFAGFALFGMILSTFISNTAAANLLIPALVSLDEHRFMIVIGVAIACSIAMALPVSTPPNAIAFGSGIIKSKDMLISGSIVSIVLLLLTMIVALSYWQFIF
ncbi:MAG: SLC13 family permease [Nitrospinota bacterium]